MTTIKKDNFQPFEHIPLRLVIPGFEAELTDLIMYLEYLRKLVVKGTTPKQTFFQIKSIFHMLESIGSARIEGNRTTVLEYIDEKLENKSDNFDSFKEIENMEHSLKFIDDNIETWPLNRAFVSELHKGVVSNLAEEGSKTPGEYRNIPVKIRNSTFVPPPFVTIPSYMDELFDFIANDDAPKYDLIKIALAHHRFVWIHPFDNGNGRTVRLFTYALMIKLGFKVNLARIINPTAIFCCDRDKYYAALSRADRGDDDGLLQWTFYMLSGLKRELEKTDKLTDYNYLQEKILHPAISFSLEKNIVNISEAKILTLAIQKEEIANADIKKYIFQSKDKSDISHMIRNLVDKKYLKPTETNKRKYYINFRDNKLLRGIIFSLDKEGFLPENS
jgi:Fic family protein